MEKAPSTLHVALRDIPVGDLISDIRIYYCCLNNDIKTIGELYALGEVGRLKLKNFGRRSEKLFQAAIQDFLLQETVEIQADSKFAPSKATQVCADLYLQKKRLPLATLDLSCRLEISKNPLIIWLRCADLFDLLQLCRPDLTTGQQKFPELGGTSIECKEVLLRLLTPGIQAQAEVALYLIARTLLPVRAWGPELWQRFVPSWVLSALIVETDEHAALKVACERHGIKTYSDFLSRGIYQFSGIGPTFYGIIFSGIDRACIKEPNTQAEIWAAIKEKPFLVHLNDAINGLKKKRDFEILRDRLGAGGNKPLTLTLLAEKFQVTTSRVTQIENKAWRKVVRNSWIEFFTKRIIDLLRQNDGLITLRSLEMIEPWFEGLTDVSSFFNEILRRMPWPCGWACSVQILAHGPVLVVLSEKHFRAFVKEVQGKANRVSKGSMLVSELHDRMGNEAAAVVSPAFVQKYLAITSD